MKRFYSCILLICLIFMIGSISFGAVHSYNGDFLNIGMGEMFLINTELNILTGNATDTWYSIIPDKNVIKANAASVDEITSLGGEYIMNDHMFAGVKNLNFSDSGPFDNFSNIYGDYLFDFGLFVGVNYFTTDSGSDDTNIYLISPGYRFNINKQSYLAISFDYGVNSDEDFSEIVGYDLDYAYYGETAKFYAQCYSGTEDGIDENVYQLGAAFLINKELVIGFNYLGTDGFSDYDAGLTWKPSFMTFDLQLGTISEESFYMINGLFNITDKLSVGAEYFVFDPIDDERITLKFKYEDQSSKFIFGYVLENDSYETAYNLSYSYTFK